MSKEHEVYWLERSLQDSAKAYNFAEKQLQKLRKEYRKSITTIEKELKQATDEEKERLKDLKAKIENELDRLFELEEVLTEETLHQIYEDGYYHAVYNYQQAVGYGTSVVYIAPTAAEVVINRAWSGKNYSDRIWTHRDKLGKKVEQIMTQGTILGHSNAKMAKKLSTEMNTTFGNAARLIRTETNYVHNQATKAGYEAMGQDKYIFLATLDLRTSATCQSLDGKKFKTKDAKPGVNYPPMHPNCRSTTIPDVEEDGDEVRLAKLNGEYYEVPGSMTYEQWYKEHVVDKYGAKQAAIMKKMVVNESQDRTLFASYQKSIGVDAPKSFVEFQNIKYNNSNEWAALKRQRATFDKINSKDYSDQYTRKMKNLYRYYKKEGIEFTDHSLNRVLGQKKTKGKRLFDKSEVIEILKKTPNYAQKDGRLIYFYNNLLVVQSPRTKEIISVVSKQKINPDWRELK